MRSLIGWLGGKKQLAKTLVALLPEHETYVEVFGGAAWVLFAKEPSQFEIYNDLDGRLVALWRSVKYHPDEFCRELAGLAPSREVFEDFRQPPGLTEIQRAARFFYLVRLSYGCKAQSFAPGPRNRKNLILARVEDDVERVRQRLERATIERADFAEVLARYDTEATAFFVDPPYLECEEYAVRFSAEDHARLVEALEKVRGRWLMTYNDHPCIRDAYAAFHRYTVRADYSLPNAAGKWAPGEQLIITNYRLTKAQLAAAAKDVKPL